MFTQSSHAERASGSHDGRVTLANGRVLEGEELEFAGSEEAARNLRDLARINRWFGGHRSLAQIVRPLVDPSEAFSVLDVGAASGDMGETIRRRFHGASVTSLDRHAVHMRRAPGAKVAADAFHLPFGPATFDLVLCSSLLHHFSNAQAIELIADLHSLARRALILMDIERHSLAHGFLPWTKRLFQWSELTVHDGSISVAAAFRPNEMAALVEAALTTPVAVRRHRPWFRMSVVIPARPCAVQKRAACSSVGSAQQYQGSVR